MATVTIQVIEGLERGRVFSQMPLPVTIGREDDNTVRLNDERVSRFHAKIQLDAGRVILTDLESTNGTRVNGHPVQMRILQVGDQLSIGRCLLVFGSHEEVQQRHRDLRQQGLASCPPGDHTLPGGSSGALAYHPPDPAESSLELFPDGVPDPPNGLRPAHRAEVSDAIAYIHEQIHKLVKSAQEDRRGNGPYAMQIEWSRWQRLLKLEMDLAVYLRRLADPDDF